MRDDENIVKYVERIKSSVSAIKEFVGDIKEKNIVRKVLKNILPIYVIRVSTIQKMRCDLKNKLASDALVGRLTTFELDKYDKYVPNSKNIDFYFEA